MTCTQAVLIRACDTSDNTEARQRSGGKLPKLCTDTLLCMALHLLSLILLYIVIQAVLKLHH